MPMPTIPGVTPETWEQLLRILAVLNTSVVELGEQGITTFEQLRQWLAMHGYELVEISEVVGYTIAKTEAVDPTTTNAVANRVATDIVATGGAGTAVSQFISGGNRTLGLVAKGVAVGACMSLLISTIGAGLVSDEIKEDLITSADPYTIDGENVPVLIDENGKTHFLEEMVEAIRAKAIELGVFDAYTSANDINVLNYPSRWNNEFHYDTSISINTTSGLFYIYSPSGNARFARVHTTNGWNICQIISTDGNPVSWVGLKNGESWSSGTVTSTRTSGGETFITNRVYTDTDRYIVSCNIPSTEYLATNSNYNNNAEGDIAYVCVNGSTHSGVQGITPNTSISSDLKDTTKPLTEVLPQLATGQMSIASPTENDLTHKSNWYPVSISSEDVFTDGATEEETSSATDGDVKQDLQPAILDAINELIKQLNPDGTPDVPVSDSGDTPPENPPLTPSSGANGSNGLWAIYNPTLTQVQEFGAWLWSDSLADQFKRIFNSPIDGVIGFHMLYCTPSRGADQTIKCGFLASPVTSRTVASPYVEIDCGTVSIGEFYRNALDYDYTRISVYLPFIGIVPLDTNIVMGSDLNITYRVDVLTGTCLAQIKVIKENSDAVMYAFEGNCAVQIPLTATTYTGMVGALMSGVSAGIGVMTGNIAQAVTSGANALANMVSGKSGVKQSGTMGANAGALGIRKPYVIITHPIAYMPVNFNKLEGLPSNITATLGTLTGFTRVRSVHLENIGTATQEEINMIEELLKEGVII